MILATIQPSFLPWLGYLEQMDAADVFVYLDNVKYTRQDWRNRNRFLTANGEPGYLTVPVRDGSDDQLIKDVLIADEPRWRQKMLNKLNAWYARAPHAKRYLHRIGDILDRGHEHLVDLNYDLMDFLVQAYGISTPTRRASKLPPAGTDKNQRLIDLCLHHKATVLYDGAAAADFIDPALFRDAGITVIFQNYQSKPYQQGAYPFVSHMSSLDTLLWCGEAAREILCSSPPPAALISAKI
jgi:hypothetical protein